MKSVLVLELRISRMYVFIIFQVNLKNKILVRKIVRFKQNIIRYLSGMQFDEDGTIRRSYSKISNTLV